VSIPPAYSPPIGADLDFSSTKDTKEHEEDKNTKKDKGRGDT
jgi:hypothetical protein